MNIKEATLQTSNIMFLTVKEAAAGIYRLFRAITIATRDTEEVCSAFRKAKEQLEK